MKFKKTKLYFLFFLGLIVTSACEKEFLELDDKQGQTDVEKNTTQKNGRLYFPSEEIFNEKFKNFHGKNDQEIYMLITEMHGKNFMPLRPIVTEENEGIILKQLQIRNRELQKKIKKKGGSQVSDDYILNHIDDLEDIIGDEAFSNFLNTKAEVQIGNNIYKYTDVGLFITEESNYKRLENYLQVREISDDLMIPTSDETKVNLLSEIPEGGYTLLENDLTYYRTPIELIPVDPNPGGGGGGSTPPPPATNQTLDDFLNDLDYCNSRTGLFGNIFGTNRVCINEYENGRRVKTKAFNYDYGIAYNVGVKVKHQKKGWTGIWRKEDVEEIAMGVEYARFEYDFMPVIVQALSNINLTEKFISPLSSEPTSGIYHFTTDMYGGIPAIDYTYTRHNPYPYELFQSDLIIELWSHNDTWDKLVNEEINELTRSEKLNEYFWNTVWGTTKSQVGGLVGSSGNFSYEMPDDIIYASKHPTVGKVQIFRTLKRRRINRDKIEKSFDWGVGIKLTLNSSNNFHLLQGNVGSPDSQKPKKYHVNLFGAVKSNGKWHGSKLTF